MVTVLIIRCSFLIILPMILDTCFQWTVQIFQHIEVNNVKIKELVDKLFIAHHIQRSFISHHGGLGIELAQDLCNLESGWWLKPQKDREGNPQALGLINRLFGYLMGNFEAPVTHSLNDSRPSWVRKRYRSHYMYTKRMRNKDISIFSATQAIFHISLYMRKGSPESGYVAQNWHDSILKRCAQQLRMWQWDIQKGSISM